MVHTDASAAAATTGTPPSRPSNSRRSSNRKTTVAPAVVERFHRAVPPHATGRAPQGEGARDQVRVVRRDVDPSRFRTSHGFLKRSVDEMQTDLDAYLEIDNRNGPHRGRGIEGRTPYQVLKKGIRKPRSRKKSTKKEVKTAAFRADLGKAGCQVMITVPVQPASLPRSSRLLLLGVKTPALPAGSIARRHDPLLQLLPHTHPDRAPFDARMCAVFNARQHPVQVHVRSTRHSAGGFDAASLKSWSARIIHVSDFFECHDAQDNNHTRPVPNANRFAEDRLKLEVPALVRLVDAAR